MNDPSLILLIFFIIAFFLGLFYAWLLVVIISRYQNPKTAIQIIFLLGFCTCAWMMIFFWINIRLKSNEPWWLEKLPEKDSDATTVQKNLNQNSLIN